MAMVVAINDADDPQDVMQQAVERLTRGELVMVPTETRYVVVANALVEESVARLRDLGQRHLLGTGVLAVTSNTRAMDYVPDLGPLGCKLLRRCWPGPVAFEIQAVPDVRSLSAVLPVATRQLTAPDGHVTLRAPSHEVLQGILRLMPGPLVMVGEYAIECGDGGGLPHWLSAANGEIALVIDDGNCRYGVPSSLVRVQDNQWTLGNGVRKMLADKGVRSVAAQGFGAPGVVVSYTDDPDIQNGKKFLAEGMQIAAGVPLQCDEPADFRTFRLGLFGLDKLYDVEATLARLGAVIDRVM